MLTLKRPGLSLTGSSLPARYSHEKLDLRRSGLLSDVIRFGLSFQRYGVHSRGSDGSSVAASIAAMCGARETATLTALRNAYLLR